MFFEYPGLLWLLAIPVLMVLHYIYLEKAGRHPHMRVSVAVPWKKSGPTLMNLLRHVPFLLRILALVMIVLAIARPRSSEEFSKVDTEGIDIVLAMDVSTSMLAEDLKPNRLEAAKQVAAEFINGRPNDNIGLTVFAGQSFTQSPLTVDHTVLLNLFSSVDCSMAMNGIIEDGTAIGLGIANAVSRLKESKAKSKVIILLTDGSNNRGDISPLTAAEIAKTYGIRVYTIGTAPYPHQGFGGKQYIQVPVEIDENTLQQIAKTADGQYYRATSNSKLREVYEEIDKLERTKLNVKDFSRKSEEYIPFAIWAFVWCASSSRYSCASPCCAEYLDGN